IRRDGYETQLAIINSFDARTKEEELRKAADLGALRSNNTRAEIARATDYYNQLIALQGDNGDEIRKLEYEKATTISRLNSDLVKNQIETQARITQLEREALEERRQANIEYADARLNILNSANSRYEADLNRGISLGIIATSEGYGQLRELAADHYERALALTKEANALELQNDALTAEQRRNLILRHQEEEVGLREDYRRKLLDIDDAYYNKSVDDLNTYFESV